MRRHSLKTKRASAAVRSTRRVPKSSLTPDERALIDVLRRLSRTEDAKARALYITNNIIRETR